MENLQNELLLLISAITEVSINNLLYLDKNKVLNILLYKIFKDTILLDDDNIQWQKFKDLLMQKMLENGYQIKLEFDLEQIEKGNSDFIIAAIFQSLSVYKIFNEFEFEQKINLLNYQTKKCVLEIVLQITQEIRKNRINMSQRNDFNIEKLYRKLEDQEKQIQNLQNLNFKTKEENLKLKDSLEIQSSSNNKLQQDLKRLSLLHSDSCKSYEEYNSNSLQQLDEFYELKIQNVDLKNQLKNKIQIKEQNKILKDKLNSLQKQLDEFLEQKKFYKHQQEEYEKIFSENQIMKKLIEKFKNDQNQKSQKLIQAQEKIQVLKQQILQLEISNKVMNQKMQIQNNSQQILKEFSLQRINSIDDEVFINELQDENDYLRSKLKKKVVEKQLDFQQIPFINQQEYVQKAKLDTSIEKIFSNKKKFKKNSLQIFMEENNCVFQNNRNSLKHRKKSSLNQCNCQQNMKLLYQICAEMISQNVMKQQKLLPQRINRNRNIIQRFCFKNLLNKEILRQLIKNSLINQFFCLQRITTLKQLSFLFFGNFEIIFVLLL